jgi:hypothetical protein
MAKSVADFFSILETLVAHQVDFIIVGGVCAVLHGAPITTYDLDIVHSRSTENVDRLLGALEELEAHYREQTARHIAPGPSHLCSPGHQLLLTKFGPLDLLGTIGADLGYEELMPQSVELQVRDGLKLRLLDLSKLITIKEEAARDKDRAVLAILKRTFEEKEKMS